MFAARDVSAPRLRGKNAAAHPCWNVGFPGAHRNVVTVIQRISTTPKTFTTQIDTDTDPQSSIHMVPVA